MHLASHYPIIQRYFDNLMNSVRQPSESLQAGYYYEYPPDEEAITEIH